MRFRSGFIFLLITMPQALSAFDLGNDTIRLNTVTITGSYFEKFGAGSQVQRIDSAELRKYHAYNLNDLLKTQGPVHFKSYGSDMLSSVSFRGTGAGHTSVLWNGLNINQPTTGQSDFSILPVLAFDQVRIHYGAASSRYGSEAIGGGILLESRPDWNSDKFQGAIGLRAGSYDDYLTSVNVSLKPSDRILLKTRFYRHSNDNDFRFRNITKPGSPVERQQNAKILQYGILQDVYYRLPDRSVLSLNTWYNFSDREIQPAMTNNSSDETQLDENYRLAVNYNIQTRLGFFDAGAGYLRDRLVYNQHSEILTSQQSGRISWENELGDWTFHGGTKLRHITARVKSYTGDINENRMDLFGGFLFHGLKKTEIGFNVRQQFIKGYEAPIAPSLGIKYKLHESAVNRITLEGQVSRNYRVPALNDRYWQPGGREDLLPEKAINFEGNISMEHHNAVEARLSLSGFHYRVNDWIMWIPGPSYWIPENVRKVHASGLEISTSLARPVGPSVLGLEGYYSLTKSIIMESRLENSPGIGNQLPYTPVHLAAFTMNWEYKSWKAELITDHTGLRFVTTDNHSELPGFTLFNIRVSKQVPVFSQLLSIDLRADNILNTEYQNVRFRAMPGRTFHIGLNLFIN